MGGQVLDSRAELEVVPCAQAGGDVDDCPSLSVSPTALPGDDPMDVLGRPWPSASPSGRPTLGRPRAGNLRARSGRGSPSRAVVGHPINLGAGDFPPVLRKAPVFREIGKLEGLEFCGHASNPHSLGARHPSSTDGPVSGPFSPVNRTWSRMLSPGDRQGRFHCGAGGRRLPGEGPGVVGSRPMRFSARGVRIRVERVLNIRAVGPTRAVSLRGLPTGLRPTPACRGAPGPWPSVIPGRSKAPFRGIS